jgi:hypothetical protein
MYLVHVVQNVCFICFPCVIHYYYVVLVSSVVRDYLCL